MARNTNKVAADPLCHNGTEVAGCVQESANDSMTSANLAKYKNYARIVQDLSFRCSLKPVLATYSSVLLEQTTDLDVCHDTEMDKVRPLRVHYIGDGTQLPYLKSLCFENQFTSLNKESLGLSKVMSRKLPVEEADITVFDFDFPLQKLLKPKGIGIPYWLKQKIEINGGWEDYLSRMRRKTRREAQRMIRKFELETAIVSGREFGEQFYEELYKPYIQNRHGESSVIIAKPEFIAKINDSDIIQLLFEGQVIAAAQLNLSDSTLSIGWTGVKEQGLNKGLRGAADALDYFCMKYAFDNACAAIDMGHSRAVLSDGILRYKKKWGANVNTGVVPQGRLVFRFNSAATELGIDDDVYTNPALRFLADKPLVSLGPDGLAAHILLGPAEKESELQEEGRDVSSLLQEHYIDGLQKLHVYSEQPVIWPSFSDNDCAVQLHIFRNRHELFSNINCLDGNQSQANAD